MQNAEDFSINPMDLTYRELRKMVARTNGKPIPTANALRSSHTRILFTARYDDMTLTVYKNGFFIYECDGKETVSAVDRCAQILYRFQNGETRMLCEGDYADSSCIVALVLAGDRRRESNGIAKDGHPHLPLCDYDSSDIGPRFYADSAEDAFIRQEEDFEAEARYQSAMEQLTQRQQQVFNLYYHEGWPFRKIARELGLSQETVRQHFVAAKKRLKNFYENF